MESQEPEASGENRTRVAKEPEWEKCNLLSLDGGGIRGYWSLLALKKLMEYIADKEAELDENGNIHHSFSPEPWPDNVSQIPRTAEDELKRIADAATAPQKCLAMSKARRFLPCHYFDHICGTSTGSLIAILLGRFRMTVQDCIEEYRNLGEEVFGNPRFFCTLNFGLGDIARYSAARLEKVFESVSARRNEHLPEPDRNITFPSGRGLCRTFVTTLRNEPKQGRSQTLYLIRSYDHEKRNSPRPSRATTRALTMSTNRSNTWTSRSGPANAQGGTGRNSDSLARRNHGQAQKLEIWEVARAATAAKWFFSPLKIKLPGSGGYLLFKDGGFGANNPTQEAKYELEELYGKGAIGIVVSVGTARKDEGDPKPSFWNALPGAAKAFAEAATNPENVHETMEIEFRHEIESSYFRINDPGKLGVEMDEWKPRKTKGKSISGSRTLRTIEDEFHRWIAETGNQEYLKECATQLVTRRQERMHTARWPRFATGARFVCRARRCDQADFLDRESFAKHLADEHPERPNDNGEEEEACKRHWRYPAAPQS